MRTSWMTQGPLSVCETRWKDRVFPAPTPIPYVEFSPVWLQTSWRLRPSSDPPRIGLRLLRRDSTFTVPHSWLICGPVTSRNQVHLRCGLHDGSPFIPQGFLRPSFDQTGHPELFTARDWLIFPRESKERPQRYFAHDGKFPGKSACTAPSFRERLGSPWTGVNDHYAGKQSLPAAGLTLARQATLWAESEAEKKGERTYTAGGVAAPFAASRETSSPQSVFDPYWLRIETASGM